MSQRHSATAAGMPRIDGVIAGVLKAAKEKHSALATIQKEWPSLVGKRLAMHVKPVGLRSGKLIVHSVDPAEGFAFSYVQPQVLSTLQAREGSCKVQSIIVRVGEMTKTDAG